MLILTAYTLLSIIHPNSTVTCICKLHETSIDIQYHSRIDTKQGIKIKPSQSKIVLTLNQSKTNGDFCWYTATVVATVLVQVFHLPKPQYRE